MTDTPNAPERIWARENYEWIDAAPDCQISPDETEYVRADIHAALQAERDALAEALAGLEAPCSCHKAYVGRDMRDPQCEAANYGDDARIALGKSPLCQAALKFISNPG